MNASQDLLEGVGDDFDSFDCDVDAVAVPEDEDEGSRGSGFEG